MTTAIVMGFKISTSEQAISVGMVAAANGDWESAKLAKEMYDILKKQGK